MLGFGLGINKMKKLSGGIILPFIPSILSPNWWIDTQDTDTFTPTYNGTTQVVTSIADKGSLGVDAVKQGGTISNQLAGAYHDLNGYPCFYIGSGGYLKAGEDGDFNFLHLSTGSNIFMVFEVVTQTSDSSYTILLNTYGNPDAGGDAQGVAYKSDYITSNRLDIDLWQRVGSDIINNFVKQLGYNHDTPVMVNFSQGSSQVNDIQAYKNGVVDRNTDYTITPTTGTNCPPLTVSKASNPMIWRLGEIIMFDKVLDIDDRQMMEGYLAHKWGLTGDLPIGHPYKIETP